MVKVLELLEKELPKYIHEIKSKHSENAKAIAFSSFIQKVFDVESIDLDFEVPIKTEVMELRGRIDAVFGNLIIEFKKDLRRSLEEAKEELTKYFQAYHEKFPNSRFIGIANDGIRFRVYLPVFHNNVVENVEEIDKIDLEVSSVEKVFLWFDVYFFTTDKIVPTSEDIRKRFGLESPTFATILRQLEILFEKVQVFKPAMIKYENWNRYLEIVYGDKPNERKLFFKHTYLSTLVKLLIHVKISGGKPNIQDEIVPILFGNTFSQAGIQNFMEEDFFAWILSIPIRKQASQLFHKLLTELYVYDLEKINEDVLKELYQQLVDPDVRKLLGEFYTPDWLAEKMIDEVLRKKPEQSIMDPSCGSGTFLFKTIQYKIDALSKKGWEKTKILKHVLDDVTGFDVHPLAVIIARTNYLLALKNILSSRTGPISIPVYLSDSLKIPERKIDISNGIDSFQFNALTKKFYFPISVASNLMRMDDIIGKMKSYGQEFENKLENSKTSSYAFDIDVYVKNMISNFDKALSESYNDDEKPILVQNVITLFQFIREESDAIWPYILRNMYKPIAISYKKVDVIIGNPPWIAQQAMHDRKYQIYLKNTSMLYKLADKSKVHNIPNMELASLFFCQCVNQYLKEKGTIAFVMTRSVLDASQHENFRKFNEPQVELKKVYDLKGVSPLFRIPSCVLIAQKDGKTNYPVESIIIEGKLPSSNSQLNDAKPFLKIKTGQYSPVSRVKKKGYYFSKFSKGADLIPRNFWFVDIKPESFLGFNPENPLVISAENLRAHKPWKKVKLEGNVGREFLFNTVVATDLVPFGIIKRRLVFLPIFIKNNKVEMISSSEQSEILHTDTSKYLKKAEQAWKEHSTGTASTMSTYEWINYQGKLTKQNPNARIRVLYVGSATYMTACVINSQEEYVFKINGTNFTSAKFFVDVATYYYDVDSEDEAYYLCSIFNSKTLDDLITPEQSKGDFGPRNIHKLPLTFNIPKYDPSIQNHKILAETGLKCAKKINPKIPSLLTKSVGVTRRRIREFLADEYKIIDDAVKAILN